MSETIWTTSTTPTTVPWDDVTSAGVNTGSRIIWDEAATFNVRDIIPLEAKTRVNGTTFASKDIETIKEIVKDKLYKQLLQQLMTSGCVKIESVKNPANQSITFHARVELVKPKATSDENLKAA